MIDMEIGMENNDLIMEGTRFIENMVIGVRSLLFSSQPSKENHYLRKALLVLLSSEDKRFDALLDIEATARGISVDELKGLVLEKSIFSMTYDMELAALEYEYKQKVASGDYTYNEYRDILKEFEDKIMKMREEIISLQDR